MMVALLNGSPKAKSSASEALLKALKGYLTPEDNYVEINLRKNLLSDEEKDKLLECNCYVFAFPLYVDGIPSNVLRYLVQMEDLFNKNQTNNKATTQSNAKFVYTMINCGFYEGEQNKLAMDMMEHWCKRAGLQWGQGLGVGAGGMLPMLDSIPAGAGPMKNLGKALELLSETINHRKQGSNLYITANFPRIAYKIAAEMNWRKSVKANGLKVKDLYRKKS